MKIPIFAAIVLLTLVPAISQSTPRTISAVPRLIPSVPGPPGGVTDPANVWAPQGPFVSRVQFNYYKNENNMFNDFKAGKLDITDWPVPKVDWALYDGTSSPPDPMSNDVVLSQSQGQFGMRVIDINQEGARWAAWGCDFRQGAVVRPSACGIHVRQALRYLIDMPQYALDDVIQGSATDIADPSPPAKTPSGSPINTQLSWDDTCVNGHIHTLEAGKTLTCSGVTKTGPVGIGAYNIAPDFGGAPVLCSPDEKAAIDHLIAAFNDPSATPGHTLTSADGCRIDLSSPGRAAILANPLRFELRSDDVQRDHVGNKLADGLDQAFGTAVVQRVEGDINQLGDTVFLSQPEGPNDDWEVYTAGWGLPGPLPDHLEALNGSLSASDQCGGLQDPETNNYSFYCDPVFDTHVKLAQTTADRTTFNNEELAAFDQWGRDAMNIPAWANLDRSVILRSVDGAVNLKGNGFGESNPQTIMNARASTNFVPNNPIYKFGGGDSSTLRWGQRIGTKHLNPFRSTTQWDQQLFFEVYDTVGNASPLDPLLTYSWMANSIEQSIAPAPNCPVGLQGIVAGDTCFLITLRPTLRWQDGVPVSAFDVKFSILNFLNAPSAPFVGGVVHVKSVSVLNAQTLNVVYKSQSLSHVLNINGLPVIPEHLWEAAAAIPGPASSTSTCGFTNCDRTAFPASGDFLGDTSGQVGMVDNAKTVAGYDPLNNVGPGAWGNEGMFIGSGPFECISLPGAGFPAAPTLGKNCARTAAGGPATQAISAGGSALLVRFDRANAATNLCLGDVLCQYMRDSNPPGPAGWGSAIGGRFGQYQEFAWADVTKDYVVDSLDLGSAGACFGKAAPDPAGGACPAASYNYWLRPSLPGARDTPTTIGPEVFIVALHAKNLDTWVSPRQWTQDPATGLPNIVPPQPLG